MLTWNLLTFIIKEFGSIFNMNFLYHRNCYFAYRKQKGCVMMTKVNCNEQWCRWNRNGKWCVAEEIKMSKKAGEIVCKTKEMFYDEKV